VNIKEQIEEWAKVKEEISPWPWIQEKNSGIYPDKSTMPPVAFEVYNPADHSFIAASPQKYDQAMQALEEAEKIIGYYSRVLTYLQDKSPKGIITNEVVSLASHWLKSCGFEE